MKLLNISSVVAVCTGAPFGYGRDRPSRIGSGATILDVRTRKAAHPLSHNRAHRIVFANEKGGTGKSTTAVHVAVALAYMGKTVAAIDLDPRQRTMHRYIENREAIQAKRGIELPTPTCEVFDGTAAGQDEKTLEATLDRFAQTADFLIVDTPGRDDPMARIAAEQADTLVTPMNDSFVDFDLIGQVDAETFKVKKLSFYAELIWEARLKRSRMGLEQDRRELDWVVVRNRTGYTEARNMARLEKALAEMSKRVGFRIAKGLSERVIYRELFPSGLTLLDKGHLGDLGTSHLVARQELRGLIASLRLPGIGLEDKAA
ncbi:AAA family ATPase [Erythrobacter sp. A6_0]|jgi:chromosome partitioning protein|nr:AAA family ATPase [Erythrobacter sp. A6_0]